MLPASRLAARLSEVARPAGRASRPLSSAFTSRPGATRSISAPADRQDSRTTQDLVFRKGSTTRPPTTPRSSSRKASRGCCTPWSRPSSWSSSWYFCFSAGVRATLIPLLAVPVALIGHLCRDACARIFGKYSLVASRWCLPSASWSMTRSWWWRQSKRSSKRIIRLSPAEASRRAMQEITAADHSHHACSAFGVRSGRLHSGHFRRAVSPVSRWQSSVSMVISAINALTPLTRPCAPFFLSSRPRAQGAGVIGYVLRGIDKARDGYSYIVHKNRSASRLTACWPSSS